jgi:hypothetical protein
MMKETLKSMCEVKFNLKKKENNRHAKIGRLFSILDSPFFSFQPPQIVKPPVIKKISCNVFWNKKKIFDKRTAAVAARSKESFSFSAGFDVCFVVDGWDI